MSGKLTDHAEPTDEMVTAFMREFEQWTPLLRYKEKDGWHTRDWMGVREGLRAALKAGRAALEKGEA